MAGENLGTATLVLDVDSRKLDRALEKLRQDIDRLKIGDLKIDLKGAPQAEKQLKNISTEADRATQKTRSLAQILNDPVGGSYSKLSAQIGALTTKSRELSLTSVDYLQVLEKISRLELIRSAKTGRARVEADFAAQKTLISAERAPNAVPRKDLPNTTGADLQNLRELTERLLNVDRNSADYELTLRQIEAVQRRVTEANNGVSASLKQLQIQQDGATRRAEKLASIQEYYGSKTPAAAGIRDASGAMIARGAGSRADEKAYNAAIRPAQQLLETDLRRAQVIREISQRIKAAADTSAGGFGDFSRSAGGDPVSKAIRRNAERVDRREAASAKQREALDADLARVRQQRVAAERQKLAADKAEAQAAKQAAKDAQQAAADRKRKRSDAIGSAIIGGAFPALFGQGLGASILGAAGGGLGGRIGGQFGFGLSLVGTALGAQFDALTQKGLELAKALDDPIKNFENLAQTAVISSKQLESYIRGLIESGRGAEAQVLIQKDLFDTFGSLQGLEDYQKSVDSLNRAWARAGILLADFVSGPLARLLEGITNTGGNIGTAVRYEQLVGQLTPEQYNQVTKVRDAVARRSADAGGRPGFLPPSENDLTAGRQAAIKEAERLLGVDKQRAQIAAQLAAAQLRNKESLSTNYRLIDAQTQGYERQTLELQKQEALNERNRRLLELPTEKRVGSPEAQKIQQDAALKVYEITQRLAEFDQKRAAALQLQNVESGLALRGVQQRIAAAKELATVEAGVVRQTIQQRQEIEAGVQASKDQIARIGAQIDALRLQGGDNGPQLQKLVDEQKLAATEIRLKLIEGATALKDAGKQLKQDLGSAVLELAGIRNDPGGLNQYLNQQQIQERGQATLQSLLPQFRQAQAQFTQLTGVQAPEFRGTTSGVIDSVRQFIEQVKREDLAGQNVANLQEALNKNTADLVSVNNELLTVTRALAEKSWAVNVNVPGGTASGDVIGAVNGAF